MKLKRNLAISVIAMIVGAAAISGCNTVRGAGKDVQVGGAAIEGTAKDVQSEMKK